MNECWYFSMIMWFPGDPEGSQRMSGFQLVLGVRLQELLPVIQMEIWCSTGFILPCKTPPNFFSWISMRPRPDKSNMSSAILMYNHVSESPCPGRPVWTPQNLIYDWQLIWSSRNTAAWPAERDSVGKNSSRPIRLPADSLAPSPSVYLPPYASPPTHPPKLINL